MATQKQVDELRETLETIVKQADTVLGKIRDEKVKEEIREYVSIVSKRLSSPTFDEFHLSLTESEIIEDCRSSRNAISNLHLKAEPRM